MNDDNKSERERERKKFVAMSIKSFLLIYMRRAFMHMYEKDKITYLFITQLFYCLLKIKGSELKRIKRNLKNVQKYFS